MKQLMKFSILLLAMLAFASCNKDDSEAPETNPDDLLGYELHSLYPNAENVQIQFLGKTISCQKINDLLIFQGDIIVGNYTNGLRAAEFAENPFADESVQLWKGGKVYYNIEYEEARELILLAMVLVSDYTNIKFIELKTPSAQINWGKRSHITFKKGDGYSSSWVGMKSSGQEIFINVNWISQINAMFSKASICGVIVHEIGHSIGLMHEFQRDDRDNYVKINRDNIDWNGNDEESMDLNLFATFKMKEHSDFDFGSIMMYNPKTFGKRVQVSTFPERYETLEVITKLDGTSYKKSYQGYFLSEKDKEVINKMYPKQQIILPDVIIDEYASELISDNVYRATGELIYEGEPKITERGIRYGKVNGTPITVAATKNSETYICDLVNLEPNTNYFAEAYVIQNGVTIPSNNLILFKTPYGGLTEDIHNIIPDEYLEALEDLGLVINGGKNPPNIEGTYLATPLELVKSTAGDIREQWDMYVTFSEQNNTTLTVNADYTMQTQGPWWSVEPMSSSGPGSFIVGEGNKFTVFVDGTREQSGYTAKTVEVFSGEMSETGILDYQWAVIMVDNRGNPLGNWIANGTGYLKRDSDRFSPRVSSEMRSSKNTNPSMKTSKDLKPM